MNSKTISGDVFAIEAVRSPKSSLHVPILHILIQRAKQDKKIWVGHCLDLNICAYSNKEYEQQVIEDIFYTITEMATNMIFHLLKKRTIEDLFKCGEENSRKWNTFHEYHNSQKIKKLKKSYQVLMSSVEKIKLEKVKVEEILKTHITKEQVKSLIETAMREEILKSKAIYELKRMAA